MREAAAPITELSPDERRMMLRRLLERKTQQTPTFPLSLAQESLWFLDQLDPARPTYSLYAAVRLRGALNLPALEQALGELIRRHDTLRTCFPELDGSPVQRIAPAEPYQLPIVDLRHLPVEQREAEAMRIAEDRPAIDLQRGPVFRPQVIWLEDRDFILKMQIHHIVFDGWSFGVATRELSTLYRAFCEGRPSPLPELPVRYADFAAWQRQYLQGEMLQRLQGYWRTQLSGLPALDLPTDFPRPAIRTSRGATLPIQFGAELTQAIVDFSRRERVTVFMTLLAGFQELLHRYSGQEDFAVGTPTANRRQKNVEPLIGYFINMLVLRANLSGDPSFRQLVQRVRDTALAAYEHQELTLDKVVEAVRPQRDMSRHPLFQVMFVLQNNRRPPVRLPDLQVSSLDASRRERTSKFELTMPLRMTPEGIVGKLNFNTDLFAPETIQRMIGHYQLILADAVTDPDRPLSRFRLLEDTEQRGMLLDWNPATVIAPCDSVVERFEARVRQQPDAVAVADANREWTYSELNGRANQIAHWLRAAGVGTNQIVAVRLPRSAETIAALWGVLKAGAAYLPLDVELPPERLRYTVEDARAAAMVTRLGLNADGWSGAAGVLFLDAAGTALAGQPTGNPETRPAETDLAYVIYTSGSTGRPKGVMIDHRALGSYAEAATREYGITAADRVLQFASFSYDAHVEEVYPCLMQGGTLVLRTDDAIDSIAAFVRLCDESRVTVVTVPTGFWHEWTLALEQDELPWPGSVRLLIIGGEQAHPERLASWFERVGVRVRLLNTYGPTETTVVATSAELRPDGVRGERVPIGRPLGNTRVYVLDGLRRPVPVGVRGELYIGGSSVGQGYLHHVELTTQRFVPDPFADSPTARMFGTGDWVRWRNDGQLEFLGRVDDQVKIRGFRIEPGEIEEALREHPQLAEAAVLARLRTPGDLQLVAYVAPRDGQPPGAAELRPFLRKRLPEYMVPALFVSLERMPTTASGKVDRRSLPEPDWSAVQQDREYVPPRTETEQRLAEIWAEVLNLDRIGRGDNFFELGGNSLLAIRLTAQVRKAFSIDLPLVALFAAPTLGELADRIGQLQAEGQRAEVSVIPRVAEDGPAPLTFIQKQFWTVMQMFAGVPMSNLHATLPMAGAVDLKTMTDTINEVIRRHETLRTTFVAGPDGAPQQVIADKFQVQLTVEDLSHLPESEQETQIRELARSERSHVFDLSRLPLFRIRLLRLDTQQHVLMVTSTHIIFDGWSLQLLAREVSQIYAAFQAGLPSPLPELPIRYRDYAWWQQQFLQGPEGERLLEYWRRKLAGMSSPDLPTDRPRSTSQRHVQKKLSLRVPAPVKEQLESLARAENVTLYTVLLAAFKTLLSRYCASEDIAVAAPVANRGRIETQAMLGVFINTVILRSDLSGDPTFRDLLARVRETASEAFAHEELPLTIVADELRPDRDPTRFPLSQVMFNFVQSHSRAGFRRDRGLVLGRQHVDSDPINTRIDLAFDLLDSARGIRGFVEYDAALFDDGTAERMAEHFQNLLESVIADPNRRLSQLPMMTPQEQQQVLVDWNKTAVDWGDAVCLHQMFEAQQQRAPDAVAAICDTHQITYGELDRRANRLARTLRKLGIGPDMIVAVCLPRSTDMLVALLGTLKAGAAFLPLDPALPAERRQFMLDDSRPAAIVTQEVLASSFEQPASDAPSASPAIVLVDPEMAAPDDEAEADLGSGVLPNHLAYVIYTSGSTGRPKGVMIEHRSVVNVVRSFIRSYTLEPSDRVLQATSLSFDVALNEIFPALSVGATIVLPSESERWDVDSLSRVVRRHRATIISAAPTVLARLNELPEPLPGVRLVLSGGEALCFAQIDRLRPNAVVVNGYGPTEATICATCLDIPAEWPDAQATLPIGTPLSNYQVYILDTRSACLPVGCPGELCIGGVGLARGYLNDPELTAQKFVPHPFQSGERIYRTGDLARWTSAGHLEFLGRIDRQIKIRGQRVELGEIEAALTRCPAVREATVIGWPAPGGDQRLAAYVVAAPDADADPDSLSRELRTFLRGQLPMAMIPTAFVKLDALPLTVGGKVDLRALAEPDWSRAAARPEYVAPRNDLERQLAAMWSELLAVERIGIHDDFFALGGHSLLATQLIAQTQTAMQINLPLRDVFQSPTIAGLAERIVAAREAGTALPLPPILPVPRTGPLPVSYGQEALWLIHQIQQGRSPYVMHPAKRLRGPLNVAALERAANEVVRRHESLRTTFTEQDGQPMQVIAPYTFRELPVLDLSHLSPVEQETEVRRYTLEVAQRPIDLARVPLARLELIRLGEDEHVVLMGMHHIIYDGWSLAVLQRELFTMYRAFATGRPSPLPDLPIQYADYAVWQRGRLQGDVLKRLQDYWTQQLRGLPPLELPTGDAWSATRTTTGGSTRTRLSAELSEAVKRLALEEQATTYMALMAAFQLLLGRYSGQQGFGVGTAVAGRLRPELESLIGYFVNTLVIRADLSGDLTFRGLVRRVRQTVIDAFEHQELPFELLVQQLNPPRQPGRHPLFQAMFVLQNIPVEAADLADFELGGLAIARDGQASDFDLSLSAHETSQGIRLSLGYRQDRFDQATIAGMLESLQGLIEAMTENPDAPISQVCRADSQAASQAGGQPAQSGERLECLHQWFEARAAETPDARAVVCGDRMLTYEELNRQANQLGRHLLAQNVAPDSLVALYLDRSPETLVAILGVLKSGAAYLPLDLAYPAERIAYMLQQSQAKVVLTKETLRDRLPDVAERAICLDGDAASLAALSHDNLPCRATADNLAYVIYTSGSTGRPKGVAVSHGNVMRLFTETAPRFRFAADDIWTVFHSYAFDFSVWEIWGALLYGGTAVVVPLEVSRDPKAFHELLCRERVTVLSQTPSAFAPLIVADQAADRGTPPSALRLLFLGGEALDLHLLRPWFERHGDDSPRLINAYGPTETTVHATMHELTAADLDGPARSPIGRPIPDLQVYVLGEDGRPVRDGEVGELHIAGPGVTRGYLHNPELTAARFVRDPFGRTDAARMYRTGDLVRRLPDGCLDFAGRGDDQVKIRGFRIELGEIQTVLTEHPGVQQAIVLLSEEAPDDKRLVASFVPQSGLLPTVPELREWLRERLPEYMIPAVFAPLESFPLTANGKVDRRALLASKSPAPGPTDEQAAPVNDLQRQLADIWQELLRGERPGIHDNFFELGGHSLLALRIQGRVREQLGVELTARDVFDAPTLAELADRIEAVRRTGNAVPRGTIATDGPGGNDERLLSLTQEALWFLDQLQSGLPTYAVFAAAELRGPLDVAALQQALNELVRRHEVLRTIYPARDGRPVAKVVPSVPVALEIIDLSGIPAADQAAEETLCIRRETSQPFDLQAGPMVRVRLLREASDQHLLLFGTHHIAFDGWSQGVVLHELGALYAAFAAGQPCPLPDLALQFADFAAWQQRRLQGPNLDRLRNYWINQLAGLAPLDLPTDYPRPPQRTTSGASWPCRLSAELSAELSAFCRREGVTPFMTLLAAFQILLQRCSGQDDIAVGAPFANRTESQWEPLIGYFINVLVVRTKLSGNPTFREVLGRVRQVCLDAFEHQELTLDQVVEAIQPPRDPSRTPLVQAMFVLQNNEQPTIHVDDLEIRAREGFPPEGTAHSELFLEFHETTDGFRGSLNFNTDLFSRSTAERLIGHYELLVADLLARPNLPLSALPLIREAEQQRMTIEWNASAGQVPPETCIHRWFERQVEHAPQGIAVIDGARQWTYEQLNEQANRIAHQLRSLGAGPDRIVAVLLPRSAELIAAILGILKSGAAYLPLDPHSPPDRLGFLLEDAQTIAIVTQRPMRGRLPDALPPVVCLDDEEPHRSAWSGDNPACQANGNDLACVIYTSGSTGRPKGVLLEHRSLVNFVSAAADEYRLTRLDRVLQFASPGFDGHLEEVFCCLVRGATLVLWDDEMLDPAEFVRRCGQWALTLVSLPTAYWHRLTAAIEAESLQLPETLRLVVIGGEPALPSRIESWFACADRSICLLNTYGPTETTVVATWTEFSPSDGLAEHVSIGRPLPGVRVYVLDAFGRPVPVGMRGELTIGGAGVARGYLNRPELTAERFVNDPFAGVPDARMYRTGDLVRWRSDGSLEFLGRADDQVKIRGYRVELGEIEAALSRHSAVSQAAVIDRQAADGDTRLAAYVVGSAVRREDRSACAALVRELKNHLRETLPEYMIPQSFLVLDALPLTTSGKIDRRALPDPATERTEETGDCLSPRTESERRLAELWRQVLRVDRVGIHDDFFALGGHSLLASQTVSRLNQMFQIRLPVREIFERPTVAQLAERVDAALRGETLQPSDSIAAALGPLLELRPQTTLPGRSVAPLRSGSGGRPLFCIHGLGGHVAAFLPLAGSLQSDRPVYGLQALGLERGQTPHERIEDMAAWYVDEVRSVQPAGPYLLCGWSLGGTIALEMTRQLTEAGQRTALLALLDSHLHVNDRQVLDLDDASVLRWLTPHLQIPREELRRLAPDEQWELIAERAKDLVGLGADEIRRLADVCKVQLTAANRHQPARYEGQAVLLRAARNRGQLDSRWRSLCPRLRVEEVPGDHFSMLRDPHVAVLAGILDRWLSEAERFAAMEGTP